MRIAVACHGCLRARLTSPLLAFTRGESFRVAPDVETPFDVPLIAAPERQPPIPESPRETLFHNFNVPISRKKAPITACKSEQYAHISVFDYSNSYFAFVVFRSNPQTI
jgi:hypothetical protein